MRVRVKHGGHITEKGEYLVAGRTFECDEYFYETIIEQMPGKFEPASDYYAYNRLKSEGEQGEQFPDGNDAGPSPASEPGAVAAP